MNPFWQGWVRRQGTWLVVCVGDTWPETWARLKPRIDPREPVCILRYGTHPDDPVLEVSAQPDPDEAPEPVCHVGAHLVGLLEQIQEALARSPQTVRELMDSTGGARDQVNYILRRMEKATLARRNCKDKARSYGKKAATVWGLVVSTGAPP